MQIREGAYYRTRAGDVVGPMQTRDDSCYCWESGTDCWTDKGEFEKGRQWDHDLISEVYISDTPPSDDVMLNLSEIARCTQTKVMGEGNFGLDEDPPSGVRLRWLVEVVDNPSDTPPADAPAPEAKTLRDEFAMEAMKLLIPRHERREETLAEFAYRQADAMMEARKK